MSTQVRNVAVSKSIKLEGIRKTISQRMKFSKETFPHAYLMIDVDASKIMEKHKTLESKPSYNAILMKGVAEALKSHPMLNSYLDGEEIKVLADINIAIAVDTPFGLYAPVVGNVDKKGLKQIDDEIRELAEKAKNMKLSLFDVTGGTFTITNLGSFGIDFFVPIINPPQTGILGVGRIRENRYIYLTLSFNHSVVDGAEGARFLSDLKATLESFKNDELNEQ